MDETCICPGTSVLDETVLHALADGYSTVWTASCDALCVNVKLVSVCSCGSGAVKSLTSMGDK